MRFHSPFKYAVIKSIQLALLSARDRAYASFSRRRGAKSAESNSIINAVQKTAKSQAGPPKSQWEKSCTNDYWTNRSSGPAAVSSNGGLRGSSATRGRRR